MRYYYISRYFLYFHDSKVHVIIMNKEIPNMVDFYLKLKSKYGPLVEYKFYQKFDDILLISM